MYAKIFTAVKMIIIRIKNYYLFSEHRLWENLDLHPQSIFQSKIKKNYGVFFSRLQT